MHELTSDRVLSEEVFLVVIEAVLVGVGDVRNHEGVEKGGVAIEVKTTSAILLGRLTAVFPVTIKIAAKLRLASTVLSVGRIEAGVETMNRGVANEIGDTLIQARAGLDTSGGGGRGEATVGVVGAQSALQKGAVNALVLTTRDVGLVVARRAWSAQISLTTVEGRAVAIGEARLAREDTATVRGGAGVTVAVNRLVVNDKNVGEVNILGAVDETNTDGAQVALGLFATVRPVIVSIPAFVGIALEIALRDVTVGNAHARARNSARELGAVSAKTITAASVDVEDAVGNIIDGAHARVNLTAVLGRAVTIEVALRTSVSAQARVLITFDGGVILANRHVQSGVLDEGKARDGTLGILESGVAATRGERRTAVGRRILTTIGRVTVAILETRHALDEASTDHSTSGNIGLSRAEGLRGHNIMCLIQGLAIEIVVSRVIVALGTRADTTRGIRGTDAHRKLATIRNIAVAIVMGAEAVGGNVADTTGARDARVDVVKVEAGESTLTAVIGINVEIDWAADSVGGCSTAVSERSHAALDSASTTNAFGNSIVVRALNTAAVTVVEASEGVHLTTVLVITVTVTPTSAAIQSALSRLASCLSKVTVGARNLTVEVITAATTVVAVRIDGGLAAIALVLVAILETGVARRVRTHTRLACLLSILDKRTVVATNSTVLGVGGDIIGASNITLVEGGIAKVEARSTLGPAGSSIAGNIDRIKGRISALLIASTTSVHSVQLGLAAVTRVTVAIAISESAGTVNVANAVLAGRKTWLNVVKVVAIIITRTTGRNLIERSLAARKGVAIAKARVAIRVDTSECVRVASARASIGIES